MKAIISVVGKDTVGILAAVATKCADYKVNINDVNQTIIDQYFTMYMVVGLDELTIPFTQFVDEIQAVGKEKNLKIDCMHEDIFNMMHKI
ncbi:MAG: ACT domain-containing protein [Bacilli bacterium]|nr:ACT domain-containing protein [Bacilli bacterium]